MFSPIEPNTRKIMIHENSFVQIAVLIPFTMREDYAILIENVYDYLFPYMDVFGGTVRENHM